MYLSYGINFAQHPGIIMAFPYRGLCSRCWCLFPSHASLSPSLPHLFLRITPQCTYIVYRTLLYLHEKLARLLRLLFVLFFFRHHCLILKLEDISNNANDILRSTGKPLKKNINYFVRRVKSQFISKCITRSVEFFLYKTAFSLFLTRLFARTFY